MSAKIKKKEYMLKSDEREFLDKYIKEKAMSFIDDAVVDNFSIALPFAYRSDLEDDSANGFKPQLAIVKDLITADGKPNYGYYKNREGVQRFMLLSWKWNPYENKHFWAISLETHQTPIEDVEIVHDEIETKVTESGKIIFIKKFGDEFPEDFSDELLTFFKEVERLSFQSTRHITEAIHNFIDESEEAEEII